MPEGAARERYNGIHYYQFLGKLLKNFDADQGQIIRELKEIQEKLCRKSNLVMSFTGTEKAYGDFRQLIAASGFCGSAREREPGWYQDKLLPGKSEAFIIRRRYPMLRLEESGNIPVRIIFLAEW